MTNPGSGHGQHLAGQRVKARAKSGPFGNTRALIRIRRSSKSWFAARAALAMFAVVVQTMLPFVLAADIAATANATPICHVPSGDQEKRHQPNPANACPICTALAATIAAPAPTASPIPLPRVGVARRTVALHEKTADISLPCSYRSRAPPVA